MCKIFALVLVLLFGCQKKEEKKTEQAADPGPDNAATRYVDSLRRDVSRARTVVKKTEEQTAQTQEELKKAQE
ncbi:MAG: hypothetical protein LHV69_04445 [Elusimicrobia bacterium]|nr:hypothetical protein [Candidatus Obscuribacterium magneticum]